MNIESSFSIIDATISAMRKQGESMLNITSDLDNTRANIPDIANAESDMDAKLGSRSSGNLINLDNVPVRITNLMVAAQTYEANVGVLSRYRQMTEAKLELLG
jgi:flagellar basal body rod protein FlgC